MAYRLGIFLFVVATSLGTLGPSSANDLMKEKWVARVHQDQVNELTFREVCRESADEFLLCLYVDHRRYTTGFQIGLSIAAPEGQDTLLLDSEARFEFTIDGQSLFTKQEFDERIEPIYAFKDPYFISYALMDITIEQDGSTNWGNPNTKPLAALFINALKFGATFKTNDGVTRSMEFPVDNALELLDMLMPDCCRGVL